MLLGLFYLAGKLDDLVIHGSRLFDRV